MFLFVRNQSNSILFVTSVHFTDRMKCDSRKLPEHHFNKKQTLLTWFVARDSTIACLSFLRLMSSKGHNIDFYDCKLKEEKDKERISFQGSAILSKFYDSVRIVCLFRNLALCCPFYLFFNVSMAKLIECSLGKSHVDIYYDFSNDTVGPLVSIYICLSLQSLLWGFMSCI